MVLGYLAADVESYARCLTRSLGGEEWVEDAVDDGGFDAYAVVVDGNDGFPFAGFQFESHLRLVRSDV